jgi:hypothetical protein
VPEAVLLTGSLGLGHEMMARCCASLLDQSGWRTRCVDSMSLLGRRSGGAGERVFGRLVAMPGRYDGLHFAHLRTGSRLAGLISRAFFLLNEKLASSPGAVAGEIICLILMTAGIIEITRHSPQVIKAEAVKAAA